MNRDIESLYFKYEPLAVKIAGVEHSKWRENVGHVFAVEDAKQTARLKLLDLVERLDLDRTPAEQSAYISTSIQRTIASECSRQAKRISLPLDLDDLPDEYGKGGFVHDEFIQGLDKTDWQVADMLAAGENVYRIRLQLKMPITEQTRRLDKLRAAFRSWWPVEI